MAQSECALLQRTSPDASRLGACHRDDDYATLLTRPAMEILLRASSADDPQVELNQAIFEFNDQQKQLSRPA
jgi:hypothetical protein